MSTKKKIVKDMYKVSKEGEWTKDVNTNTKTYIALTIRKERTW
jgi:hypothetical protein